MADPAPFAKIELKTPEIDFRAEGSPEWLAAQLDKVLSIKQPLRPPAKPSR